MADMDTPSKRLSTLDWDQVWNSGLPIPDGSIGQGDRFQGTWTYSGISAAAAVADAIVCLLAPETLKIRAHLRDVLSVPRFKPESLGIPVFPPETLKC